MLTYLISPSHGSLVQSETRKVQTQTLCVLGHWQFWRFEGDVKLTYPEAELSATAWVKESSRSSITIQKGEKEKKKKSSFVWASFEQPRSSQHPKLKVPHTHTHLHTPFNTHSIQMHTNTLSKHTHTCPDNSCFSVAHSHRQTMSSSPLTVHPSPPLTSLLLPPALLLSLSSLLWELW